MAVTFLSFSLFSFAQNDSIPESKEKFSVHWADEVLEFSSERKIPLHSRQLHPDAYKATMALGKPDIMPGNEGTAKIWQPKSNKGREFIKVGFNKPIKVKQLAISEVFAPSAIDDIYLYTVSGKEIHLDYFRPKGIPVPGRLLLVFIDETYEEINAVKLVLNGSEIPGISGIDAIGISESYVPVEVFAAIHEGIYTALDPEKLDDKINSPFKEIKPLLSPDGQTMFFSRIEHPDNTGGKNDKEDIWVSTRNPNTGEWSEAVNAGKPLNNDGPNFIASISPSGYSYQLLLGNHYLPNGKMINGLSLTTKTSEGFAPPEPIEINDFENYAEHANFFMGSDGRTILMSVQTRDTRGERDLYVSFLQNDATWSIPMNLGSVVNTPGDESCPFMFVDGKTLFFSSTGHLGYGGSDVFVSKRLDDTWTNWTEPENLGTAVNSKEDDLFFYLSMENDSKYAYFTRGDGDDADIYRLLLPLFQLPDPVVTINGRVLNSKTMEPVGDARISFRDPDQHVILDRKYSDPVTGRFEVKLPLGRNYELYANQEGYIALESQELELIHIYEPDTIPKDIFLEPIEVGQRIPLDYVYFEFDKDILREESTPQLQRILDFMVENPTVEIELDGHTCSLGSEDYNQRLSEKRAQAVRKFLVKQGVAGNRISSVGRGEMNPVASNESEEGRQTNRRVEFIIKSR